MAAMRRFAAIELSSVRVFSQKKVGLLSKRGKALIGELREGPAFLLGSAAGSGL